MSTESMRIAILGLTVTSSWGNGHASTYRGLIAALDARGHEVVFLERDVPWYRDNRDLHDPPFCRVELYDDLDELRTTHAETVEAADAVIVGSYVPDGVDVADWVLERAGGPVAFYDIDTPAERARTLPCAVDPDQYHPVETDTRWALGYLGTYSDDRQPRVEELLCAPARRLSDAAFVVAGPQYPDRLEWPTNVRRIDHLPPPEHAHFYSAQRWTLNITRDDMRRLGHSPSVRLFEAAARADVPVPASGLADEWDDWADSRDEVVEYLTLVDDRARRRVGRRARSRALA
ncbi:MAG: glycosyltransferase [Bradymonadaceae bacterium]